MVSPLLLLAGAGALAMFLKGKGSGSGGAATTTDQAVLDANERYHPAAEAALVYVRTAMASNDRTVIENAAKAIESYGMPRTAANLRAWGTMIQGGHGGSVAGDDEIGAVRRRALPRPRASVPDWLKFQATIAKLGGDPNQIRATATAMRRLGYSRAADIHLSLIGE